MASLLISRPWLISPTPSNPSQSCCMHTTIKPKQCGTPAISGQYDIWRQPSLLYNRPMRLKWVWPPAKHHIDTFWCLVSLGFSYGPHFITWDTVGTRNPLKRSYAELDEADGCEFWQQVLFVMKIIDMMERKMTSTSCSMSLASPGRLITIKSLSISYTILSENRGSDIYDCLCFDELYCVQFVVWLANNKSLFVNIPSSHARTAGRCLAYLHPKVSDTHFAWLHPFTSHFCCRFCFMLYHIPYQTICSLSFLPCFLSSLMAI